MKNDNKINEDKIIKRFDIIVFSLILIMVAVFSSFLTYTFITFRQGMFEGMVVGKNITVSDNWLVYEDASFISNSGGQSGNKKFDEVYYELQEEGYVKASKGNLYKVSYDKKITVGKQTFYLVGGYCITSPDTITSSDEPIKLPEE